MLTAPLSFLFFFNDTATTEIYTLSLHDALPISAPWRRGRDPGVEFGRPGGVLRAGRGGPAAVRRDVRVRLREDRKSTRLNSSHPSISYAVFCLKKKKKKRHHQCRWSSSMALGQC